MRPTEPFLATGPSSRRIVDEGASSRRVIFFDVIFRTDYIARAAVAGVARAAVARAAALCRRRQRRLARRPAASSVGSRR